MSNLDLNENDIIIVNFFGIFTHSLRMVLILSLRDQRGRCYHATVYPRT